MFQPAKSKLEILAVTLLQLIDKYEVLVREEREFDATPHTTAINGIVSAMHGELKLPLPPELQHAARPKAEHRNEYKKVAQAVGNTTVDRSAFPKQEIQVISNAAQTPPKEKEEEKAAPVLRDSKGHFISRKQPAEAKPVPTVTADKVTNENVGELSEQLMSAFEPGEPDISSMQSSS